MRVAFLCLGEFRMKANGKAVTTVRFVLCYCLAAALLGYYLVILYLGMNPKTSQGYRAFYLDREIAVWPGESGIDIVPGQIITFESESGGDGQGAGHIPVKPDPEYIIMDGWQYVDTIGYCITSWEARLLFYGQPGQTYHGSITFTSPQAGGEVTLFANDEQVAFEQFPEAEQTVVFDTPALPEDGRLVLHIVLGGDLATPLAVKEMVLS